MNSLQCITLYSIESLHLSGCPLKFSLQENELFSVLHYTVSRAFVWVVAPIRFCLKLSYSCRFIQIVLGSCIRLGNRCLFFQMLDDKVRTRQGWRSFYMEENLGDFAPGYSDRCVLQFLQTLLWMHVYRCISMSPSVCLPLSMTVCLSLSMTVNQSVSQSVGRSVCVRVSTHGCVSLYKFATVFVCLLKRLCL